MISSEILEKLAAQCQTGVFPNIIREYFQHIFLSELYKLPESEKLLFKGGTALRIIYGSPRFSEDLDFSLTQVHSNKTKYFVESLFIKILATMENFGVRVELGERFGTTSGGYFGLATLRALDYPPVGVEINVSARNGREIKAEIDSVASDFIPPYTAVHLSQMELVEEKIFGALLERKKPRDFYDLYFLMRKRMLSSEQKRKLADVKDEITKNAREIDFHGELGAFLPADQQAIIRDFSRMLEDEMKRQIA